MDREWEKAGSLLPVQPSGELVEEVMQKIFDEEQLGENLILYHRESMEQIDPLKQTVTAQEMEQWRKSARRRWGAVCTCSYCEEDFEAGWHKGGIALLEGEDGQAYDGWAEAGAEGVVEYDDDDAVVCPRCGMTGRLTPRKELRRGRTYRMLQAEVVNAGDYTAVMYWMIERRQDDWGGDHVGFLPHQALVIDRGGRLRRFRWDSSSAERADMESAPTEGDERNGLPHQSADWFAMTERDGSPRDAPLQQKAEPHPQGEGLSPVGWRAKGRVLDPFQQAYYSYDAQCGKQIGGWVWGYGPELTGHTGEKTALDEYIGASGHWPAAYLLLWQRRPQVENLMRQGFAFAVARSMDRKLDNMEYQNELNQTLNITWVDWSEVKPHRMLGMSKEAFRVIKKANWTSDDAECWALWRTVLGGTDARRYEACRKKVGCRGVRALLERVQAGWNELEPEKAVRYLEKKGELDGGVQHLLDYRKMLRAEGMDETAETLWPRDLIAAHDRLAEQTAAKRKLEAEARFITTLVNLDGLEWTDGRLCIVIPKSEQELKDEGRVLRHCVGSYASSHCGGKPVFFVRHYRRPERSYYTLNIDMTGAEPKRIQLHGYGNERHGEHKQYKHSIPREVMEFCDRWEREVLAPWWKRRHEKPEVKTAVKKKNKEVHAA